MTAVTEIYVVDDSNGYASGSGSGAPGTPYTHYQFALDQEDMDSYANGVRFNIKEDATNKTTLTKTVDYTAGLFAAGVTNGTYSAPVIIQGYSTSANDGGRAKVTANSNAYSLHNSSTYDYIYFVDIDFEGCTGGYGVQVDDSCYVINCSFTGSSTTNEAIFTGAYCLVINNTISDWSGEGILLSTFGSFAGWNYIADGATNDLDNFGLSASTGTGAYRNIIELDGASNQEGILYGYANTIVISNSVFGGGSTNEGIRAQAASAYGLLANNLVENFTTGIQYNEAFTILLNNTVADCTTGFDPIVAGRDDYTVGDNNNGTTDVLNDPENGDFQPVDTGSVKDGQWPTAIGNVTADWEAD